MKKVRRCVLLWTLLAALLYIIGLCVLEEYDLWPRSYVQLAVHILLLCGAAAGILQILLWIPGKRWKIVLLVLYGIGLIAAIPFCTLIAALYYAPDHTEIRDGKAYSAEDHSFMGQSWVDYYEAKNFFFRGTDLMFTDNGD